MPLRAALDGSRKRDGFIRRDAPIWLKSFAAPLPPQKKNMPQDVAPFIKAPASGTGLQSV